MVATGATEKDKTVRIWQFTVETEAEAPAAAQAAPVHQPAPPPPTGRQKEEAAAAAEEGRPVRPPAPQLGRPADGAVAVRQTVAQAQDPPVGAHGVALAAECAPGSVAADPGGPLVAAPPGTEGLPDPATATF